MFRATGSQVKFAGFLVLYTEDTDEENTEEEGGIPEVDEGMGAGVMQVIPQQRFTQPPPRYSEAMLVKTLEEKGIGRPSTYAPTIDTILKRHYVVMEEKRFHPTELGQLVVDLLKENFRQIVDPDFTAVMEEKFDRIEEGKEDWVEVIRGFYLPFAEDLEKAEDSIERVRLMMKLVRLSVSTVGEKWSTNMGGMVAFWPVQGIQSARILVHYKRVDVIVRNAAVKLLSAVPRKDVGFMGVTIIRLYLLPAGILRQNHLS